MEFRCLIATNPAGTRGYYAATSTATDDDYVVRQRPKGDGWMAINDTEGIVIGEGLSFAEAKSYCVSYDKRVAEAIVRI